MKETCGYCDLNETGTYAGSGFLWGSITESII